MRYTVLADLKPYVAIGAATNGRPSPGRSLVI
jgi:hypothetical protein